MLNKISESESESMIVNIPLVTGNKLNCFISAREVLSIILPCALVLFLFLHDKKSCCAIQKMLWDYAVKSPLTNRQLQYLKCLVYPYNRLTFFSNKVTSPPPPPPPFQK